MSAASLQDVALGYSGAPVLTGLSFSVAPGERLGVLGPNGGGKTTLFRVVSTLQHNPVSSFFKDDSPRVARAARPR